MKKTGRLHRGLRDISPLFVEKRVPAIPVETDTEQNIPMVVENAEPVLATVMDPEIPGDRLFLNTFFASALEDASVITMVETPEAGENNKERCRLQDRPQGRQVPHFFFPRENLLDRPPLKPWPDSAPAPVLFLDFEYEDFTENARIWHALDKVVLVCRPGFDSLRAAYAMIKQVTALNHRLEFYLVYEGRTEDGRGALLFEKLSDMVSRYLGIHLIWLGFIPPPGDWKRRHGMALDRLFLARLPSAGIPEKVSLTHWYFQQEEALAAL